MKTQRGILQAAGGSSIRLMRPVCEVFLRKAGEKTAGVSRQSWSGEFVYE